MSVSSRPVESPRTAEQPMAFTRSEFLRGARAAWLWFLLFATVAYVLVLGIYGLYAPIWFVPWSFGALIAGSAPAYLLGCTLRSIGTVWVHLALFAAFGGVVGASTTWLALTVMEGALGAGVVWAVNIAVSVVAVPLGWRSTQKRAFRRDEEIAPSMA